MKKFFLIDQMGGGGAEKCFKIVTEELARRDPDNVTLVVMENRKDYELAPHLKCVTLVDKLNARTAPLAMARYLSLIRKEKPDIQISTNTKGQVFSLAAKLLTGLYTIPTVQVDLPAHYHKRSRFLKGLLLTLRGADAYCFISRGIFHNVEERLPQKPHFFIPNPIDFEEIHSRQVEPMDPKYAHIFEKPVAINVGRLAEQKSQHTLLEAFAQARPDWNLIILGSGEREEELKQLTEKLGITDNVFFLGFQTNPFQFLYNADLFVLSSAWEGFGNVIVEAMGCGLPVVSTECPSGPREIIAPDTHPSQTILDGPMEEATNGILVPVDNPSALAHAITHMVTHDDQRAHYKERSLLRAQDYSREKVASAYLDMIQELK